MQDESYNASFGYFSEKQIQKIYDNDFVAFFRQIFLSKVFKTQILERLLKK